jgi:hypothetical protein
MAKGFRVRTIAADGYKPTEVPAKFGFFEVRVKLAQVTSSNAGEVVWTELSEDAYRAAAAEPCQ